MIAIQALCAALAVGLTLFLGDPYGMMSQAARYCIIAVISVLTFGALVR